MADSQAEVAEKLHELQAYLKERNGELFVWLKVPGKTAWATIQLKDVTSVSSVVQTLDEAVKLYTEGLVRVRAMMADGEAPLDDSGDVAG